MAFLFQDQNQGIRNDAPRGMRLSRPFSFIRTLTVGFGITPNLLTLPQGRARPSSWESACPHYLTAKLQAAKLTIKAGHTARAKSEFGAPDSQRANPIPVCSHGNR